jgi:hypothetical protein
MTDAEETHRHTRWRTAVTISLEPAANGAALADFLVEHQGTLDDSFAADVLGASDLLVLDGSVERHHARDMDSSWYDNRRSR